MDKIIITSPKLDDPNLSLIKDFFRTEFPPLAIGDTESLVTLIASKLIGSRNYRLTGAPSIESQAAIRDVIRINIENGTPIPMLVPSGPKKPVEGESIDITELSALRVLACVQRQIQEVYPAGLDIRIRMEDATGYYLEGTSTEVVQSIDKYINDFSKLIRILGYDNFITPIRETTLVDLIELAAEADTLQKLFDKYILESEGLPIDEWENLQSYIDLVIVGWKGIIPPEMREYYHHRYRILFPDMSTLERVEAISKYFSSTLSRRRLNFTAVDPKWGGKFIVISFTPPVLGEPIGLVSTRIHYRTVPMSHTKKHQPYWRAKGYLKLNGDARMSIATWNEKLDLTPFEVVLRKGSDEVTIKADYMIVE